MVMLERWTYVYFIVFYGQSGGVLFLVYSISYL